MKWRLKMWCAGATVVLIVILLLFLSRSTLTLFGLQASMVFNSVADIEQGCFVGGDLVYSIAYAIILLLATVSILPVVLAFMRQPNVPFIVFIVYSALFIGALVVCCLASLEADTAVTFDDFIMLGWAFLVYAEALTAFMLIRIMRNIWRMMTIGTNPAKVRAMHVVVASGNSDVSWGICFELDDEICMLYAYRTINKGDAGATVGHLENWLDASSFKYFKKGCMEKYSWGERGIRVTDGSQQWREPYARAIKLIAPVIKMNIMRAYANYLAEKVSAGEAPVDSSRAFVERVLEEGGVDVAMVFSMLESLASGECTPVAQEVHGITYFEIIDFTTK